MYLTPVVMMMIAVIFIGIFLAIAAVVLYRRTFKNVAMIARQTGNDPADVVWIHDRFRVKNINGHWVIQFLRLHEKTQSIEGKLWTRFISPKSRKKLLSYTKEDWGKHDLSKHIQRGVYFYETTEGEFFPMKIVKENGNHSFSVLTQDNRLFILNEMKNINNLTSNRKTELLTLGGIIAACLVLGVIFIFGIIYLNEASKSAQQAQTVDCANYARAVLNITQTGTPTFIESVAHSVGGAPGG